MVYRELRSLGYSQGLRHIKVHRAAMVPLGVQAATRYILELKVIPDNRFSTRLFRAIYPLVPKQHTITHFTS